MKTENLIKALENAGIGLKKKERMVYSQFQNEFVTCHPEYYGDNGKWKICFYDNHGVVCNCQVMGVEESNESHRDYFPGYFPDTIKSATKNFICEKDSEL